MNRFAKSDFGPACRTAVDGHWVIGFVFNRRLCATGPVVVPIQLA